MLGDIQGRVKVSPKIKTILRYERVEPELKLGSSYYISFGCNYAYPCTLINIINEFSQTEVEVKVMCKSKKDGR